MSRWWNKLLDFQGNECNQEKLLSDCYGSDIQHVPPFELQNSQFPFGEMTRRGVNEFLEWQLPMDVPNPGYPQPDCYDLIVQPNVPHPQYSQNLYVEATCGELNDFVNLQAVMGASVLENPQPGCYDFIAQPNILLEDSESQNPCGKATRISSSSTDNGMAGKGKDLVSDAAADRYSEKNGIDEQNGVSQGGPYHRTRWTKDMVKILLTALAYLGEDEYLDGLDCRIMKSLLLSKMGKWRCISNAMTERGHLVSPQQCEDKFHDLKKKYKKLIKLLGRGNSCKVVENPELLDELAISEQVKEEVRKILRSKQLFFKLMCSYYNRNELFLPRDPHLELSLWTTMNDYFHSKKPRTDKFDNNDQNAMADGQYDRIDVKISRKRFNKSQENEDVGFGEVLRNLDYDRTSGKRPQEHAYLNQVCHNANETEVIKDQQTAIRLLEIEEEKLQINWQMHEIEKQHLKWKQINQKQDWDLGQMRLENERMKHKNERIALEIEHKKQRFFKSQAALFLFPLNDLDVL